MHKYTLFFLAALFVCGTWSKCPAETESAATEPDSTAADSGTADDLDCNATGCEKQHQAHLLMDKKCHLTGGSALDKYKKAYVWAVPCKQSDDLSNLNIFWGGPHVSLGRINDKNTSAMADATKDFPKILDWASSKVFDKNHWNVTKPTHRTYIRENCQPKNPNPDYSDLPGYHMSFKSDTLEKIQNQLKKKEYSSWFEMEPEATVGNFHASLVTGKTPEEVENLFTEPLHYWTLALVEVGRTDPSDPSSSYYIHRVCQGPIYGLASTDGIPEPTTLLLSLLALAAVPLRVRCG